MTENELRDAINSIIERALGETRARIEEHRGDDWLWGLFSRAVLLTGGATPLFASVDLRDDNGPVGSIVVVTESAVVRVKFDNPVRRGGEFDHDISAESVPRSAITGVSAGRVDGSFTRERDWPLRAAVQLQLDRELAGSPIVDLPIRDRAHGTQALELAALVSALF
ncbi:MAG: hypothetical protein Q7T17_10330 [Microbacterium sp.]|uniref:hypothetical protein n=1 Tax=Microbacterium sp. TaxID=51671 RepID=UPI0027244D78|nr:hypothetical protein [Microbacterium sp.]MDO8383362.1 hypothetical protein [Microbacterium sp.]